MHGSYDGRQGHVSVRDAAYNWAWDLVTSVRFMSRMPRTLDKYCKRAGQHWLDPALAAMDQVGGLTIEHDLSPIMRRNMSGDHLVLAVTCL